MKISGSELQRLKASFPIDSSVLLNCAKASFLQLKNTESPKASTEFGSVKESNTMQL